MDNKKSPTSVFNFVSKKTLICGALNLAFFGATCANIIGGNKAFAIAGLAAVTLNTAVTTGVIIYDVMMHEVAREVATLSGQRRSHMLAALMMMPPFIRKHALKNAPPSMRQYVDAFERQRVAKKDNKPKHGLTVINGDKSKLKP